MGTVYPTFLRLYTVDPRSCQSVGTHAPGLRSCGTTRVLYRTSFYNLPKRRSRAYGILGRETPPYGRRVYVATACGGGALHAEPAQYSN